MPSVQGGASGVSVEPGTANLTPIRNWCRLPQIVTVTKRVNSEQRLALALRLWDLEDAYPRAADKALEATAGIAGELVAARGWGTRKDCGNLARSWFPEAQDAVWAGFSRAWKARRAETR